MKDKPEKDSSLFDLTYKYTNDIISKEYYLEEITRLLDIKKKEEPKYKLQAALNDITTLNPIPEEIVQALRNVTEQEDVFEVRAEGEYENKGIYLGYTDSFKIVKDQSGAYVLVLREDFPKEDM